MIELPTTLEPLLLEGNVVTVLAKLPPKSVQCVVTSPPYLGKRDYSICGCSCGYGGEADSTHDFANRVGKGGLGGPTEKNYRLKKADSGCPRCAGTGRIPGMDTLWGGSSECDHEFSPVLKGLLCRLCAGWFGMLGQEPKADCLAWARGDPPCSMCYVCHMRTVAAALHRVLRDDGIFFLNIGDTYSTHPAWFTGEKRWAASGLSNGAHAGAEQAGTMDKRAVSGLPEKNLILVPFAVAFALRADGWILRSRVTWWKRNPTPDPADDRPSQDDEPVFEFVKQGDYFYDDDAVRSTPSEVSEGEGYAPSTIAEAWTDYAGEATKNYDETGAQNPSDMKRRIIDNVRRRIALGFPPGGKLRTVWDIPVKAYRGQHRATFPRELPERCILLGTSEKGACPKCGTAWDRNESNVFVPRCACGDPNVVPCIVLDIFSGSGTTIAVARENGRRSIGIDLNPVYFDLQLDRPEISAASLEEY